MGTDRKATQARIARLLSRGDLDGAVDVYMAHLETDPDDWGAMTALAEIHVRRGDDLAAITQFRSVADYFFAEGFLARASALYKRIVRLREDDHALLSLTDISAQQGHLSEAKNFLLQLEQQRRARGDTVGADECLVALDAMITARANPIADAAPAVAATASIVPLPDAVVSRPSFEEPPPADLPSAGPVPFAGLEPPLAVEPALEEVPEAVTRQPARPAGRRRTSAPSRSRPGQPSRKRARPLQSIFDEMRTRERETEAVAAAHEHFDRAQYHLREGDEEAAMEELRQAAAAAVLRFPAAAQLGRLCIGRGDLAGGIEWFERAASVPPVSPDEGLAILYELAAALQQLGEGARALAVLLELNTQRRAYRDVVARIATLMAAPENTGQ